MDKEKAKAAIELLIKLYADQEGIDVRYTLEQKKSKKETA